MTDSAQRCSSIEQPKSETATQSATHEKPRNTNASKWESKHQLSKNTSFWRISILTRRPSPFLRLLWRILSRRNSTTHQTFFLLSELRCQLSSHSNSSKTSKNCSCIAFHYFAGSLRQIYSRSTYQEQWRNGAVECFWFNTVNGAILGCPFGDFLVGLLARCKWCVWPIKMLCLKLYLCVVLCFVSMHI